MTGLFGSTVLEVAIGMAFLYLLLATFCTTANEWIAAVFKTRGKLLASGLKQMLDGQSLTKSADGGNLLELLGSFYKHPLVTGLMDEGTSGEGKFSYMSARSFAKVVMDLVTPQQPGSITFDQLETGIKNLPDGDVKTTLLALIQNTNNDLQQAQRAIEGWFDDTMDRVSGWYKRRTQLWTLIVAGVLTIATNADTLQIARQLWTEPVLRSAVVESAKERAAQPRSTVNVENPNPGSPANPKDSSGGSDVLTDAESALLGQILGWKGVHGWGFLDWFERVAGWILTILAVSLGAPFWFDTLNKFVNLRSAGKSPDETAKTPEKPSSPPENRAA